MIHVAIAGIRGRLGKVLASHIAGDTRIVLAGGIVRPGTSTINLVGNRWVRYPIVDRVAPILEDIDVLIDVSAPAATMHHALACVKAGRGIVVGTRGLDPNHVAELQQYSQRIPVFYAPNFCAETAAVLSVLPKLLELVPDMSVDVGAIDCGSGLTLISNPENATAGAPGLDDPLGGHVIVLAGHDQEIVLRQRVYSPDAYARGALRAVRFLAGRSSGFFTMNDLLYGSSNVTNEVTLPIAQDNAAAASVSGNGG